MSDSPSPSALSDDVAIRRADDGTVASISIKGAFGSGAETKVTRAFKVRQTADRINLTQNPSAVVATAKFAEGGAPIVLDMPEIPPAAGQGKGGRLVVSFQWQDGNLVGVGLKGNFESHVEESNKIYRVFRVTQRENEVRLTLDSSEVAAITRIETADLGEGVQAKMYCPSTRASRRALGLLKKEPDTIEWFDRVERGSTVWDIGANVGSFTLYAAMKRDCRVLAFEPAASNYMALNRNIQINGLEEKVTAYCVAVARDSAVDRLYLLGTDFGDAFCNFGSTTNIFGEQFEPTFQQGSVGFSLDDLARTLPFPSYLKIDVDGLEREIILGGPKLLGDPRVRSAVIELDRGRPALIREVAEIMGGHGFGFRNEPPPDEVTEKKVINAIFDRRT